MKMFHEEIHGLFLHLQSRHLSPSHCFSSDFNLFSLKMKKYLHRHPADCWLKYTYFMKIGQPKLSERVKEVGCS